LKDFKSKEVDANWVSKEIDKDISRIEEYLEENNSSQVDKCLLRLGELKQDLINNENNPSGRITVLKNVRENRREIDYGDLYALLLKNCNVLLNSCVDMCKVL
jgi:hypothetical protein